MSIQTQEIDGIGAAGPRVRIMIVEDDALVGLGIRLTLTELGYEVVGIAASEPEAVHLAATELPLLALMDIRLKGPVDGIDTARRLRAEFNIRSLYLSAYADEPTLTRVAQTYPLGFVQKPYVAGPGSTPADRDSGSVTTFGGGAGPTTTTGGTGATGGTTENDTTTPDTPSGTGQSGTGQTTTPPAGGGQ